MKKLYTLIALLLASVLLTTVNSSCEFDTSDEPDFPVYVSYSVTAGYLNYNGPQELINDFEAWVTENNSIYDTRLSYTTGEASEFAKTDAEAIQKYDAFVAKFRVFLDEAKSKLASGHYGSISNVTATFCTYAARIQGKDNHLRYEEYEFVYPDNSTLQ